MALIPHEILREIGAYWAGHRLLYTCKALYAYFCPDDYVIVAERTAVSDYDAIDDTHTVITVSQMPSGTYHGKCVNSCYYDNNTNTETIEYDRGRVVSLALANSSNDLAALTIINGWACYWMGKPGMGNAPGTVHVCSFMRENVPTCDFITVASELVAGIPECGQRDLLRLLHDWGDPMPGTQY